MLLALTSFRHSEPIEFPHRDECTSFLNRSFDTFILFAYSSHPPNSLILYSSAIFRLTVSLAKSLFALVCLFEFVTLHLSSVRHSFWHIVFGSDFASPLLQMQRNDPKF